MKYSLFTTPLAFMIMTLISMTVRSAESLAVSAASFAAPSVKISGVSTLLQILNSATAFTNSTFDIITIDSFFQSITDQGVVIQGKVTLTNDEGESVTGLISGVWDPSNNKIVFNATKYEVETEESDSEGESEDNSTTTDDDDYTSIDVNPDENDSQVSAAFNWGVKDLIEKGERQNKIPISDYSVTEWVSAAYKNQTDGVSYKFVAELLGANYVHVETNMTVNYRYSDQSYSLNGYYYKATNISEGSLPNNFTDVDNSTNSTNSTDPSNNSTDVNNNSTDVNNGTNSTNSTNSTVIPPGMPENYTYISPADLANNTVAQAALDFGVDALIQKAISQYKLPAASPDYNVTNLILSAYKNTSTGANYVFYTNLANVLKYKVDTNITVAYRASNQTFKLAGYAFKSYNYPSGAIVIPNNTNSTNSTNNATNNTSNTGNSTNNSTSNGTVPNNSTNPGNATQPANNSTTNSTGNVTTPANGTNSTNSTTPVNQTADGYTIMSAAQLANDSIAQGALGNGTITLIRTGVDQDKIPPGKTNYTINNITLAAYKKVAIGNYYKFQVNMTNVNYVHVDANLTVFYRYSTKVYSLNGYSFRSYNFSSTPGDMDPPIYDDGNGDIPIIIEPSDGGSGAR